MLDKVNTFLILLVVVGIGVAAYYIYDAFTNGALSKNNPDNNDPSTGQYNGPVNALDNYLFPQKFPGGGEVAGSSETYTGAVATTFEHPVDTLKSILGMN